MQQQAAVAVEQQRASTPEKLWTVEQVAEYLGVKPGAIYEWCSNGTMKVGRRVGRRIRFIPSEVEAWVKERP